jgi:hypothetical protein
MVYRCCSREEKLKMVRVFGVRVFGVGICLKLENLEESLKLEFNLDIMVESFLRNEVHTIIAKYIGIKGFLTTYY